jgi:hypothetical protein
VNFVAVEQGNYENNIVNNNPTSLEHDKRTYLRVPLYSTEAAVWVLVVVH